MRYKSLHLHRIINPQHLGAKSGAAFGATLYRDFVLSGATECHVDNASKSFILLSLFKPVQLGAGRCLRAGNRT
jgi:hypothetical protein